MKTGILKLNRTEIKYTFLKDSDNNWLQLLYTITPEEPEQIKDQIETIEKAESEFYETFNIKKETHESIRVGTISRCAVNSFTFPPAMRLPPNHLMKRGTR